MKQQEYIKTKIYINGVSEGYRLTKGELNAIRYLFKKGRNIDEYSGQLHEVVYKTLAPLRKKYPIIDIYTTDISTNPIAVGLNFQTFRVYDYQRKEGISWEKLGYKETERIPAEKYNELKEMFNDCVFNNLHYDLLAQWGKELMPIETMVKEAKNMFVLQRISNLTEIIVKAEADLELIEINANRKFIWNN